MYFCIPQVLVMLCLPLVTLADTAEGSLGALCGSKKNGIFASAPCKTELRLDVCLVIIKLVSQSNGLIFTVVILLSQFVYV